MDSSSFSRRTTLALFGGAALVPKAWSAPSVGTRPRYHIAAPPGGWINDPQRPVKIDGIWNLWALYNPTFPSKGTEWRRWTSADLVTWTDRGISIPRDTTPYGDLWTGSTVIDTNNTAGFGAGALIAIVTMPAPDADGQNQSCALWYSLDGGKSFSFHAIVLSGTPSHQDFRDPSVFWHAPSKRWILTLSQRGKIGFYASDDLQHWRYLSGFADAAVGGVMECSQFFKLHLYNPDGTTTSDKWVLLVGGNGSDRGFTIGTYYWVGDFDGTTFSPTSRAGQWLDHGTDFYATVAWRDPDAADPLASAYAIGWMQNWNYAQRFPGTNGYKGQLSIVRQLRLELIDGTARLLNRPLVQQDAVFSDAISGRGQTIGDGLPYRWPSWPASPACRIDFTLIRKGESWPKRVTLSVRRGGSYVTNMIFLLDEGQVVLDRSDSGPRPTDSPHWSYDQKFPCDFSKGKAAICVFVDASSVELFLNGGQASASDLISAPMAATGISLASSGEPVSVSDVMIRSVR